MEGTAASTLDPAPGDAEAAPVAPAALQQTGDTVTLGFMLPLSGGLQDFGGDMARAVRMAADQANNVSSGGLLGQRSVEVIEGDTQTDPSAAPQELQRLIEEGVVGVVGAASSGVTGSILPTAVQNEIVLTTPASTSPTLTERENNGFFYRVPPPDSLQGRAMAQLLQDDGCESINILAVNNDYGKGFANTLEDAFEGDVGKTILYDEDASSFDTEASEATSGDFDALVFIGYPGAGVPIYTGLLNDGRLGEFPVYFSEGVKSQDFVDNVGDDADGEPALRGFQGTTPAGSTNASGEFQQEFEEKYGHAPGLFAAESYDAAIYMLLAIHSADSTDPTVWQDHMRRVANPPGVQTHDLDQAFTLLSAGQDIDWIGAASDLQWDDRGEVVSGTYAFWQVDNNGTIQTGEPFKVGGS